MKDFVWVVEVKENGKWVPWASDAKSTRAEARGVAAYARFYDFKTRVRKYQRVGK